MAYDSYNILFTLRLFQLFDEFEVLQGENQEMRLAGSQLDSQLEEAHQESLTYKTSLDKYQALESQYKRYGNIIKCEDHLPILKARHEVAV